MRIHSMVLPGLVVFFALMLLPPTAVAAGTRHSGTVVEVGRDGLIVDELGLAGREEKLHINVTATTRVVESQRNPRASGPEDAFTENTIALSDIKTGDFVVVDTSQDGKQLVAESVMVTLRGGGK
jgi:hypothetical protein